MIEIMHLKPMNMDETDRLLTIWYDTAPYVVFVRAGKLYMNPDTPNRERLEEIIKELDSVDDLEQITQRGRTGLGALHEIYETWGKIAVTHVHIAWLKESERRRAGNDAVSARESLAAPEPLECEVSFVVKHKDGTVEDYAALEVALLPSGAISINEKVE